MIAAIERQVPHLDLIPCFRGILNILVMVGSHGAGVLQVLLILILIFSLFQQSLQVRQATGMKHYLLTKIQTQYTGHTIHFTIHIQISNRTNILTNIKSLIIKYLFRVYNCK